jgi:hypothetical protein
VNTLAFHVQAHPGWYVPEVRVLIDGRDLIDLVREVEAPWAAADGQPELSGGYAGLWPEAWRELPEQDEAGRAAILACECGEVGCWPLHARITRSEASVTWSDFAQPHRPEWRHDRLGPFVFERAAYDRAIEDLLASSTVRDV